MKVLVFYKTTTLDWRKDYFARLEALGELPEKDLSRLRSVHEEHHESVEKLKAALERAQVTYTLVQDTETPPDIKNYGIVITVGGDGTLLKASHLIIDGQIIVGVRSSGTSVGHLCAVGVEGVDELVKRVKSSAVPYVEVSRLRGVIATPKGTSVRERKTPPALNDFLYSHVNPAATTRYQLTKGKTTEVHKSSGIWVATPVGSSAGIHAAGGKLIEWSDKHFQYRVRELLRPPGEKFILEGGLFDPDKEAFHIENRCDEALLAVDGQQAVFKMQYGESIRFERAEVLRIGVKL